MITCGLTRLIVVKWNKSTVLHPYFCQDSVAPRPHDTRIALSLYLLDMHLVFCPLHPLLLTKLLQLLLRVLILVQIYHTKIESASSLSLFLQPHITHGSPKYSSDSQPALSSKVVQARYETEDEQGRQEL